MTYIAVATPSFDSIEQFDRVVGRIGRTPDGLEARYVGAADDGRLRVVTVWESRTHSQRFFTETLRPLLERELGLRPDGGGVEVLGIEVAREFVRTPVG